ncbi:MAG: hypothetical protein E7372_02010 [Clostridiales bacterium]|nr:hypothetical protein [Clostridiales bacterium]
MENLEKKEMKKSKNSAKKVIIRISIFLSIVIAFLGGFFLRSLILPTEANISAEIIGYIEHFGYSFDENGNPINLNQKDYANALIAGLNDDYARYYTKEEYDKIKKQQAGSYSGFGMTINTSGEYPIITNLVGNSPADRSGLKVGDILISATANGNTAQFNSVDIGEFLGNIKTGEVVEFVIERNGQNQTISVIKSNYKATYVKYFDSDGQIIFDYERGGTTLLQANKIDVDSDTALIKIESFESTVAYELGKAMDYMIRNNKTKLILDLRDNGGGYMDDLLSVSRHLIYNGGEKALIAYAQGKTKGEEFYMYGPIERKSITDVVVLANDGTASASECLIGAMLDYGEKGFTREKLVLEKNTEGVARTYGKGIMQSTFLLSNGGAFKLTTARILWPKKTTCIHGIGIRTLPENEVNAGDDAIVRAREILSST